MSGERDHAIGDRIDMSNGRFGRRVVLLAAVAFLVGGAAAGAAWYFQDSPGIPGDPADLDQVAFGSRVYARICANCHGVELDGQLGWEKPLKDGTRLAPAHSAAGETWQHSDAKLFEVVKVGGETLQPDGKVSRMPGFGDKLTDDEIWAVIAFIKSTWPTNVQEVQQGATEDEPVTN
ncbi:MAG: cytochrome c [Pseudomonadota bacterium]